MILEGSVDEGGGPPIPPAFTAPGWLTVLEMRLQLLSSLKPLLSLLLMPVSVVTFIAYLGGQALLRKTLPFGAAVSTCVLLKALGESIGPPFSSFQPSSAIVVVVLLMEPGITVERLLLRASERVVGTCMGCGLAVTMALLMDILGKEPLQICSFCFAAFTMFGAVQAHHGVIPFVFSVMCIACAVVIFGFMTTGWAFIRSQVASVLIGEIVSLSSSLFFEALLGNAASSRSQAHVVAIAKEMVDKAFVAMELVFIHNEAAALRAAGSSPARQFRAAGRRRTFSPGVLELLSHTEPHGSMAEDLGWLESQEAGLESRSRACLADMAAVEKLWGMVGLSRKSAVPLYGGVLRQIHFLFLQACTLARGAPLDPEVRSEMKQTLDGIRFNVLAVCQPLRIFLGALNATNEASVEKLNAEIVRMCDSLKEVHEKLDSIWIACKQQWQSAYKAASGSAGQRIRSAIHMAKQKRSAAAFCQGFDAILAATANLVREHLHVACPDAAHAETVDALLHRLEEISGLPPVCQEAS